MRGMNRDKATTYESGLGMVNSNHSARSLHGNKMYSPEMVGTVDAPTDSLEKITKRKDTERGSRSAIWITNAKAACGTV